MGNGTSLGHCLDDNVRQLDHLTHLQSPVQVLRLECELAFIHDIISKDVPNGNLSLVCDSFDFFGVLRTLPKLKDVIEARGFDQYGMSKVVIRPDSGDPVKIVTGYKVAPQRYATAGELFASIPLDGHAVFAAQYEAAVVDGQYRELGLQSSGFEDDVDTLYVGRVLSGSASTTPPLSGTLSKTRSPCRRSFTPNPVTG